MARSSAALALLLSFRAVLAQTPPASPAFEVADVKVNKSGEIRMAIDIQPGGRVAMRNVPMKILIAFAYHLRPERVTAGPPWLESERYDVVAKAPEKASPDEVRRMAQTLLAERFKLAVHTEQRLMPAYALVQEKSGTKLQPSEAAVLSAQRCVPGQGQPEQRHVECRHMTLSVLADYLQELAPRDFPVPVVDQTGLAGAYDFKLDWTPAAAPTSPASTSDAPAGAPAAESGTTIFDAVQSQLGLKLESRRLPLPVLAVDHVERVPVEN